MFAAVALSGFQHEAQLVIGVFFLFVMEKVVSTCAKKCYGAGQEEL